MSFPPLGGGCTQTFPGFTGDLSTALDRTNTTAFKPEVAASFRQWKTLCTIPNAQPGTYMVQVKTNLAGNELTSGHNRFSLRAYGASSADNDAISVAGYNKMAMYANTPNGTSKFFLARVPSGAHGTAVQRPAVRHRRRGGRRQHRDGPAAVGDGRDVLGLQGAAAGGDDELTGCQISVSSSYNAKWQTISVPIPAELRLHRLLTHGLLGPPGVLLRRWVQPGRHHLVDGQHPGRPGPPRGVRRAAGRRDASYRPVVPGRHACRARSVVHETMRHGGAKGRHDVLEGLGEGSRTRRR